MKPELKRSLPHCMQNGRASPNKGPDETQCREGEEVDVLGFLEQPRVAPQIGIGMCSIPAGTLQNLAAAWRAPVGERNVATVRTDRIATPLQNLDPKFFHRF